MRTYPVKDALKRAAAHLNDQSRAIFTDDVLLPYFQTAYEELLEMLEENNAPFTNSTSAVIPVNVGTTQIGNPDTPLFPQLPEDLVEIQDVWERLQGSNIDFTLLEKRTTLPLTSILTSELLVWSWQGGIVNFIGANTARDVKINYVSNGTIIDFDINTRIKIINSKNNLSYRTAGLAAYFVGENKERADELNGNASGAFDRLINLSVKGEQSISTRRRPFRAGLKQRGYV